MLASVIWGYWWLTWTLAIVFLFIFPSYYEILFWGVMYDSLYGISLPQFWGIPSMFTISSIVLLAVAWIVRNFLLAYEPTI